VVIKNLVVVVVEDMLQVVAHLQVREQPQEQVVLV